jgi:cell division protein FtsL
MNILYNWVSYLSGNIIISLIFFISVEWDFYNHPITTQIEWYVQIVATLFLLLTILSTYEILYYFNNKIKNLSQGNGGKTVKIFNLKMKNIFSTSAMSYYIIPFSSFAAGDDNIKNLIALTILVVIFGIIYVKERMILYTPILILFGYMVFSCTIKDENGNSMEKDILVKRHKEIILGGSYSAVIQDLNDTTLVAFINYN